MHQDFFQTDCRGNFSKTSGFISMDCGIHENLNEYLQICNFNISLSNLNVVCRIRLICKIKLPELDILRIRKNMSTFIWFLYLMQR